MSLNQMQFQLTWREYQARVLAELETHLDDRTLHVVAAPGSGKTVLGLEVLRRIGLPTLVVAPTIAIRNQWIQRLEELFLPQGHDPLTWVSTDIWAPGALTCVTYQALYAAFANEASEEGETGTGPDRDVIAHLRAHGIRTLVLDEAHHLRRAWWRALFALKDGLDDPHIVALTATPPYDVDRAEWQRYTSLCGSIDSEISVPELVKRGDLCPHQDYVYFSTLRSAESAEVDEFNAATLAFAQRLKSNDALVDALRRQPWFEDPEASVEQILAEPRTFSAIIVFLNWAGYPPSERLIDILGVGTEAVPTIDPDWLAALMDGLLFRKVVEIDKDILAPIRSDLRRMHALGRHKVTFSDTRMHREALKRGGNKLDGIGEILRAEAQSRGPDLRMVVLADYVRANAPPPSATRPVKLGVIPIFEHLRLQVETDCKLGVLTGSAVIVPASCRDALCAEALRLDINESDLGLAPLPRDTAYLEVNLAPAHRGKVVRLVTAVFAAGGINLIVGTTALLGEGWDAPALNVLVLASSVRSFMLSNQMRGRAIRTDPAAPGKVASIWHLATVFGDTLQAQFHRALGITTPDEDGVDPFDRVSGDLGVEMEALRRRFRAFVGPTADEPFIIENGFGRLSLSGAKWSAAGIVETNRAMLRRAADRDDTARAWQSAMATRDARPALRERIASRYAPRGFYVERTIRSMVVAVGAGMLGILEFATGFLTDFDPESALEAVPWFAIVVFAATGLLFGSQIYKIVRLTLRTGSLEKSLQQVTRTVAEALFAAGHLRTTPDDLDYHAAKMRDGAVYCSVHGGTPTDNRLILDSTQELLGPIEAPRYIIARESRIARLLRVDYHPVPALLGRTRKTAEMFERAWLRNVGPVGLVSTRTEDGRRILLKARLRAFSAAFVRRADRFSVWE